ncbi:hypothetical protein F7D01_00720 [Erythrobacter sp. 3-20A1M]|uniref:beta family protein n=1 Tax=Erythrobacter sp. 3-20A1M TaxID=2653850 RepID=UPI001BFC089A|nr:hypothetical protein F7D01_00720 [Erythrobacter sp. 3-20A1M]
MSYPLDSKHYFPGLTIREGECRALGHLASPTKDLLFPLVRLQAWPRSKAGAGGPIDRSLEAFAEAFGPRPFALDLAAARSDLDSDWGKLGTTEITQLHDQTNGHDCWCTLIQDREDITPVTQLDSDPHNLAIQIERYLSWGRGLVIRLRRSRNWDLDKISPLALKDLQNHHVLIVFDCEQIGPKEDLTAVGTLAQNAILAANNILKGGQRTYVLMGSSFPSSFADIHPEYASLPLRERQLFDLLRMSPPLIDASISLEYGDHAAVYAAERPPAFKGAPRVDYPTASGWIYHRSNSGFDTAALRTRQDPQWDDDLLCWGAQRIRTAAGGDMTGLKSQSPWVAVRINIHLHRQAHAGGDWNSSADEEWVD